MKAIGQLDFDELVSYAEELKEEISDLQFHLREVKESIRSQRSERE
jgi:hypothetical protein